MGEEAIAMGQRLQDLRQKAGLSQSQLATAAGVPVGSLKNWEQGRRLPQLDAAYRIARALGITLDELAGKVFEQAPADAQERRSTRKTSRGKAGSDRPPEGQPARRKGRGKAKGES